ncbi:hmg box transcriptional regulator [Moniliophthora roreri]|nr:hmg box transcriptional regulator [Moniliophthora roreri]
MLTTQSRIQGWEPAHSEGDEVVIPSHSCQIFTFNVAETDTSRTYSESFASSTPSRFHRNVEPASEFSNPPRGSPGWIPRPRNPFIIFRCDYIQANAKQDGSKSNKSWSKQAAEAWRSLPAAEKAPYLRLANEEKMWHARMYPDYRFQPRKRSGVKKGTRPSSRRQESRSRHNLSPSRKTRLLPSQNDEGHAISSRGVSSQLSSTSPALQDRVIPPIVPLQFVRRDTSVEEIVYYSPTLLSSGAEAGSCDVESLSPATTLEHSDTSETSEIVDTPPHDMSPSSAISSSLSNWDGGCNQSVKTCAPFHLFRTPKSLCPLPTASAGYPYCCGSADISGIEASEPGHPTVVEPWQHNEMGMKELLLFTGYARDTQLGECEGMRRKERKLPYIRYALRECTKFVRSFVKF